MVDMIIMACVSDSICIFNGVIPLQITGFTFLLKKLVVNVYILSSVSSAYEDTKTAGASSWGSSLWVWSVGLLWNIRSTFRTTDPLLRVSGN